ncbi:MAG: DUF4132 domain-containing protein, partial [Phycisphaerales bacterium]|nr:DUF4132 domain-containing protein [Phycisphaerales bacterium]
MSESRWDVDDFVRRFCAVSRTWSQIGAYRDFDAFVEEARDLDETDRGRLALRLIQVAGEIPSRLPERGERRRQRLLKFGACAPHAMGVCSLAATILRRKVVFSPDAIAEMLEWTSALEVVSIYCMPQAATLIGIVERRWRERSGDERVRRATAQIAANAAGSGGADEKRLALRIQRLIDPEGVIPIEPGEIWGDAARRELEQMAPAERSMWTALLSHCNGASSSKPSAKWIRNAVDQCERIGFDPLRERLAEWFKLIDTPGKRRAAPDVGAESEGPIGVTPELVAPQNADTLRGLCWAAGLRENAAMARSLGAVALSCYRKLPGIGPRAPKVGNAAIYALGGMPGRSSLGQLAMLRVKVKVSSAQKLLEKALDAAAEREGLPRDEIEEMSVPSYGLTDVGVLREPMGACTGVVEIRGASGASATSLVWMNENGKSAKSVPAAVKRDHAEELKELKASMKDIQRMLPAQRDRIDSLFLERRSWAYETWRERYLDHPLVGTISRRLIWQFDDGRDRVAAAWLADAPGDQPCGPGRLVRVDGARFDPAAE